MQRGFFNTENTSMKVKKSNLPECARCKLSKTCLSPKIKPSGKGKKEILIIAEAPTEHDDDRGANFTGDCGTVLRRELKDHGIDLDNDCTLTTAVICRPPKGRGANKLEVASCRPNIMAAMEEHKPHLVILLGSLAVESLIGSRWNKDNKFNIHKWRGFTIPDQKFKAWICPILDPKYVLRQRKQNKTKFLAPAEFLFKQDIKAAVDLLDVEVPDYGDPAEHVKILSPDMAKDVLQKLLDDVNERRVSFDYETTGLKPHDPKHYIVSASICFEDNRAYAFSMDTGDDELEDLWCDFLTAEHILKAGANIKFEEMWGRTIYDVETTPWDFDVVLGAHVIDNRSGITGLKFQTYVQLGFSEYGDEMEPYLSAKGSNALNRAAKAPRKKLLLYNGMDSWFTHILAQQQIGEIYE